MSTFPELLTSGIYAVRTKTGKSIAMIHDELGHAVGAKTMIEKWRNSNNENSPNVTQTKILAEWIFKNSDLGRDWQEEFITASSFSDVLLFKHELLFSGSSNEPATPLPDSDWDAVQQACQAVERISMVNGRRKYDPKLYLQRHEAVTVFDSFLQSEEQILIITGKSGVGKSSLLHALLDRERSGDYPVCFLGYDCNYLEPNVPLREQIERDFEQRANLSQIWERFDRLHAQPNQPFKQFVLLMDALNEHQEPKELLRNLDRSIRRLHTPWLKVVITSRPEAWRQIYRQAQPLTKTLYYRQHLDQAEPGFELSEFHTSIEPVILSYPLPLFHLSELAQVYEMYRARYEIKTPFERVTPAMKNAIRDPLFLSFMALMYRSKAIPESVHPHRIYQNYLEFLAKHGEITRDDERFLHNEFVQLMDTYQGYRNEVSFEQFKEHCYQLNKTPDVLLKNLIDVNILTQKTNDQGDILHFTFERFYDYFMGKYLWRKFEADSKPIGFIKALSQQLSQTPFLWGATMTMLRELFEHGAHDIFEQLGYSDDELLLRLLMALLTEQYPHHSSRIEKLLQRWLDQTVTATNQTPRLVAHIAITCGIAETLNQLLTHPNKTVRNLVVQDIYRLWQQYPILVRQILSNLAKQMTPHRFINPSQLINTFKSSYLFMTLVDASFLLYLSEYSSLLDSEATDNAIQTPAMLQQIWHPLLNRYLLMNMPLPNRLMQQSRYWAMFLFFRHKAVSYIKQGQRERFSFDFVSTRQFYPPSPARQQMIQRLTANMNAAIKRAPESVESLTDFIFTIAEQGEENFWVVYIAELAILSHLKATPIRTTEALTQLLERIATLHPPGRDSSGNPTAPIWYPMITHLFFSLSHQTYAAMPREIAKQILLTFIEALRHRVYDYGDQWRREFGEVLTLDCLEPLLFGYALQIPEAGAEMLAELVDFYAKENDHDRIAWGIYSLAMGMNRHELPQEGLQAIHDFIQQLQACRYFETLSPPERAALWEKWADDLLTYASKYRTELSDLLLMLDEEIFPESFKIRLQSNHWQNVVVNMNFMEGITWGIHAAVQDNNANSPIRRQWIDILRSSAEAKSVEQYMLNIAIRLITMAYPQQQLFSPNGADQDPRHPTPTDLPVELANRQSSE